jgi:hypothetical protein
MDVVYGFMAAIVIGVMYWLPTIIAANRKVKNVGSVAVIDGLLGWTMIGWVVAMAMACSDRKN